MLLLARLTPCGACAWTSLLSGRPPTRLHVECLNTLVEGAPVPFTLPDHLKSHPAPQEYACVYC